MAYIEADKPIVRFTIAAPLAPRRKACKPISISVIRVNHNEGATLSCSHPPQERRNKSCPQNKTNIFDELIAPNFKIYDPPLGMEPNREGFRQIIAKFRGTFPNIHLTIEDEFADGDYVIQRGYVIGPTQANFRDFRQPGKKSKSMSFTSGAL